MAEKKTWSMNETQSKFVQILKDRPDGVTLFDLKLEGIDFKSGSINTLISKGIVATDGEKEYSCKIVYNGQVVGNTTKHGTIYKLVR